MKIGLDRDEDTMKLNFIWMVVKIMLPLWILRGYPKRD